MRKKGWSCLIIGILFTTISCQPLSEDNGSQAFLEPAVTNSAGTTAVAQQPTATSNKPQPTPTPPPKPTPEPTSNFLKNWQLLGDEAIGLQIAIPPDWENFSSSLQLDSTALNSSLGLLNLLAANSERVGSSVLAGKDFQTGAFMAGLITNLTVPAPQPEAGLQWVLQNIQATDRQVSEITTISLPGIAGAYADILGNPILFSAERGQNLVTRILFLTGPETAVSPLNNAQAIYIFSATLPEWERYQPLFSEMIETIAVHNLDSGLANGDGRLHLAGEISNQETVNGRLDNNLNDIWTFTNSGPAYATISLKPETNNLDLTLTVIDPAGQTVAKIDHGYAGDIETAADLLLTENGRYLIEVSDFFRESGSYVLDLTLSGTPIFSGGGQINPGQSIQSDLPPNGQQFWTFTGTAGDLVSIVVTPDERFDALLNMYGPDGRQLVALDEGFSGDAEVVSGFELPATGEYTILVQSFAGNSGSYTLSLDEGGESTSNFYDAGDLVYGDIRQESLRSHEAHAWFFSGRTGDMVMIEVKPLNPTLDLEIWLLDENINRIAAQDTFLQGENELIDLTLPQNGQYLILVRDFNGAPGDYEIRLAALPVATPVAMGVLQLDSAVSGVLEPDQSLVYYFDGLQNDTIHLELLTETASSDLALTLLSPNGRAYLRIDDGQAGQPENYTLTLPENGRWGIVVNEFFDEGGAFTLTVSRQ
ncbi:MAG: PPC domain-containing protein [Chloroflexi bacterium]|nr:PPC domain-containing protein [Chloroflexota bacterium]MBP7043707.1 PPC domain-containing protein [Chloroflexota bacterium]